MAIDIQGLLTSYLRPAPQLTQLTPGYGVRRPAAVPTVQPIQPAIDIAGLFAGSGMSPLERQVLMQREGEALAANVGQLGSAAAYYAPQRAAAMRRGLQGEQRSPEAVVANEIRKLDLNTAEGQQQAVTLLGAINPQGALALQQRFQDRAAATQAIEKQNKAAIDAIKAANINQTQRTNMINAVNADPSGAMANTVLQQLVSYAPADPTSGFTSEYRSWLASRGGDYTAEGNDYISFLQETKNIEDDETLSNYGRMLEEGGLVRGTPAFQERMTALYNSLVQMQRGEETLTPIEELTLLNENIQKIPSFEATRTVLSTIPNVKVELRLAATEGNGQAFITATRRLSDLAQGSSRAQSEMEEFRERNNIVGAFTDWVEEKLGDSGGVPTDEFMNRLNRLADSMMTQAMAESERQLSQIRTLYGDYVDEDTLASFEAAQRLAYSPEQSTEDLVTKYLGGTSPNFNVNFSATLNP